MLWSTSLRRHRRDSTDRCRVDADRHIRRHPPFFKDDGQPKDDLEKSGGFFEKMMFEQSDGMMTRLEVKEL
jgi:hypothetical protein